MSGQVQRDTLYRLLARHLPRTALFLLDSSLRILVAEGQALLDANFAPHEIEGRLITEVLVNPSAELLEQYRTCLASGQEMSREYEWPYGYFVIHTIPVKDSAGGQDYLMVVANNITEERHVQHTLAAAERRNRALLEALPDAMFISSRQHIITELHIPRSAGFIVSHAFVGRPLGDLPLSSVARQKIAFALEEAFRTQQVQTFEYIHSHDGQATYYEGRTLAVNEDIAITLVRDITTMKLNAISLNERKHDLELLRAFDMELNRHLSVQHVLELLTETLITTTRATCAVIYLYDQGFRQAHRLGVPSGMLCEQADAVYAPVLEAVRRTRNPLHCTRGAHCRHFLLETSRMLLAMPILVLDQISGVVVLEAAADFNQRQIVMVEQMLVRAANGLRNASLHEMVEANLKELSELYARVRRLEQIKTDMIRIASHDLKGPLTGMRGYLQLLRADALPTLTEEQRSYFHEISRAADRMQDMVQGILSLDRIQQMAENTLREAVDLRRIAQAVVHEHLGAARRQQIQLDFTDASDSRLIVLGDVFQLQEAIVNLVTNALKYTPQGGRVEVAVRQEGEDAVLTVRDTGYGIPTDQQQRLFSAFYRVTTHETRQIEGTGLGLHLVRNIINRHDGRVFFESIYGRGSLFGFALPLAHPALAT